MVKLIIPKVSDRVKYSSELKELFRKIKPDEYISKRFETIFVFDNDEDAFSILLKYNYFSIYKG